MGDLMVITVQGNGSSGPDSSYPGGSAGSSSDGGSTLQTGGPPGLDSGLLTLRSVPEPLQISSPLTGPGATSRNVASSSHVFPDTSVTSTVPWPSRFGSHGTARKFTDGAPEANSSTLR